MIENGFFWKKRCFLWGKVYIWEKNQRKTKKLLTSLVVGYRFVHVNTIFSVDFLIDILHMVKFLRFLFSLGQEGTVHRGLGVRSGRLFFL